MKWRLALFSLLTVLALGGMAAAHGWLYAARDQVYYEATEVWGDPSVLSGLCVENRYEHDRQLLWTTRFDAADPIGAETRFSYHLTEQPVERGFEDKDQVGVFSSVPLYDTEITILAGNNPSQTDITRRMAWDVARGLEVGETATETIRVADYGDILPLELSIYDTDRRFSYPDQLNQRITEMLAIPLPEDLEVSLTVSLGNGYQTSISISSEQDTALGDSGVILEDAVYLTLWPNNDLGLDLTHSDLGYGIYRIPIERRDGTQEQIVAEISNFYPLDPAVVDRAKLLESPVPGQLLVLTWENGQLFLTVVNTGSGQALLRVELPGDSLFHHLAGEDILLLTTRAEGGTGEYFTVLDFRDGEGALWMRDFCASEEVLYLFASSNRWCLAFDGTRLAVACCSSYDVPGFGLIVFDTEGQAFRGNFLCDAALVPAHPNADVPQTLSLYWQSGRGGM